MSGSPSRCSLSLMSCNRCLIKCLAAQSCGNKLDIVYINRQPTLSPICWPIFRSQRPGSSYSTSLSTSSLVCTGRAAHSGRSISLSTLRSLRCKGYSVLSVLYASASNRRSVSWPLSFLTCSYFLRYEMRYSHILQYHLHGLHDPDSINETLAFLDCKWPVYPRLADG